MEATHSLVLEGSNQASLSFLIKESIQNHKPIELPIIKEAELPSIKEFVEKVSA